ncbi:MAG: hypothetical protein J0L92_35010 [Deltaproteobacteria bacterium]|nr:hypothetical protein [Deltaproteobacteria bacterium]
MAYRDDNDALRARVAELERRLALSEALVDRLMGRGASSKATRKPDSLVGEVVHRVDETTMDVTLDEAGLEAAANVVRARLGHDVTQGVASLEGARTRLGALGERRVGVFGLATNEHGTSLRLETDLRRLPLLVALGPVLGAMLSMPLVIWQWSEFHHFREAVSMSTSMSVLVLTMVLGTVATRVMANRIARRENELHQGVWAALLEITRTHARLPAVRVAAPTDESRDAPEDEPEHAQESVARATKRAHA